MVRQRKPHPPPSDDAKASAGGSERPERPGAPAADAAAAAAKERAPPEAEAGEPQLPAGPALPLLAASLVAAWLLLALPRGAYFVLSPQTGDWLAGGGAAACCMLRCASTPTSNVQFSKCTAHRMRTGCRVSSGI